MQAASPSPAEPFGQPLMLPQHLTEAILRTPLAELGNAHALDGFEQDADGVTARVRTPEGRVTVRSLYLVGADGGRSFVRKALAIGFPGEAIQVRAVVADLTLSGLSPDLWHRWGDGARQIAICPLMGRCRASSTHRPPR